MKCINVIAGFSLLLLLASCSGDKQADTPTASSSKPVPASTQAEGAATPASNNTAAAGDGSCLSIMEADCLSCHNESRICQRLGKKSEKRWERTIDRMIKHGSKLSSADKDALIQCLFTESPDIVQFCK